MRFTLDEIGDAAALGRRLADPAEAGKLRGMSRPLLWAHPDAPAEAAERLLRALRAAAGDAPPWRQVPLEAVPHLPADYVYLVDAASLARRGGQAGAWREAAEHARPHGRPPVRSRRKGRRA